MTVAKIEDLLRQPIDIVEFRWAQNEFTVQRLAPMMLAQETMALPQYARPGYDWFIDSWNLAYVTARSRDHQTQAVLEWPRLLLFFGDIFIPASS